MLVDIYICLTAFMAACTCADSKGFLVNQILFLCFTFIFGKDTTKKVRLTGVDAARRTYLHPNAVKHGPGTHLRMVYFGLIPLFLTRLAGMIVKCNQSGLGSRLGHILEPAKNNGSRPGGCEAYALQL